jgi:hypothetical protein
MKGGEFEELSDYQLLKKDSAPCRVRFRCWKSPRPTCLIMVKVKLSLCLTKNHAMKAYWGVEV